MSIAAATENSPSSDRTVWLWLLTAWLAALLSTLSALFIGEVMGQAPCVLCWFQRAFMFPLAVILGIACAASDTGVWRYALPLAAIGWLLALYHMLLYAGVIPESIEPCSAGPSCSSANMAILEIPIPALSLAAFSVVVVLLILVRRRSIP